ncbi:MAG: NTP transferase domain-containing protein [Anaerolineales bacterium]|nr:NTP transferase domain-containing protein [Anaerolineales bacterium]
MSEKLKIVIPMAGLGTRLRPITWSRPKQLVTLAGKTVLGHVLSTFETLPNPKDVEYIFIVGYLGEKIEAYMQEHHPHLNVRYVVQEEMRGQSHAIYLAREHLQGPMLMVFADTLIETDLAFLGEEDADIVAWVKPVPDPRRFGVTEIGADGLVTRLIEKPKDMHNNLAVVGFYYFKFSEDLIAAIETQIEQNTQLKGEFFLADAVNIMLERGARMRTQRVDVWLDAGTPDAVLESNHYLLENGRDNSVTVDCKDGITLIPPVYIHPSARIKSSVIGPYTSIGANCVVENCLIQDSILESGAKVSNILLDNSLIGQKALVTGSPNHLNVGDNSAIEF